MDDPETEESTYFAHWHWPGDPDAGGHWVYWPDDELTALPDPVRDVGIPCLHLACTDHAHDGQGRGEYLAASHYFIRVVDGKVDRSRVTIYLHDHSQSDTDFDEEPDWWVDVDHDGWDDTDPSVDYPPCLHKE